MSDNESREHHAGSGGPTEGQSVRPGRDDPPERTEQEESQEIPLGMPISDAELRELKERARRPSVRDAHPPADVDESDEEA